MRPADEPPEPAPRPLRSDAAANAERVLAAAIRTGLGEGRHVPLAEIAREAGVGVGTLYRRYPNRDALLEALEVRAYGLLIDRAEQALTGAGTGLAAVEQFLVTSYAVRDQLVLPLHGAPWTAGAESARARFRMRELMTQIVRRGHEDGTIRADVTAWTVVRFGSMLAQPMPANPAEPGDDENADQQRRIFLRGISGYPQADERIRLAREGTAMPPASTRAVRFDRYGGPDVLYVSGVPTPKPGPGEVLVEVRAAAINPGEGAIRSGAMDPQATGTFPSGEGSDLAGVVVATGPDVTAFGLGDEVLGYSWTRSSHATHAAVPVTQLIRKPAGMTWEVAGSLYVVGVTAYAAARAVDAGPGDVVAVSAAAGGVGRVLTQLLVHRGARVLGIASKANADWLTAHGAVPVEYGGGERAQLAGRLRAEAPDGIDAFIDLHGPEYLDLAVDLGVARDRIETIISYSKAGELGTKAEGSTDASTPEVMQEMADLVTAGVIEIDIAATYPLEDVAAAFTEQAKGHTAGKIVLLPWASRAEALRRALAAALPADVVLTPGSSGYQDATSPDNSSFEQTPAAVVRVRSGADVVRAIQAVRDAGGQAMVQATGHGAGLPVGPGVVLIDTSALDQVQVNAEDRVARAGAGTVWSKVQEQAWPRGLLALSGTSPTVGVSGYTFHGGVGWLARPFGLASGSLRSVDYVDGTGVPRRATADSPDPADREALWAFRGGAPVGVATELEFDLHPVPDLWAGYLLWPGSHLPALAAAWARELAAAPDALTSTLSLLALPPQGPFPDALKGTTVVHLSYASVAGEAGLAGLRSALRAVAEPAVDTTGPADAAILAQIHLDPPGGIPARGMGQWLSAAPAELIVTLTEAARVGQPGGLNMLEIRHVASDAPAPDGALTRAPGPFLLHTVGAAGDDAARAHVDDLLHDVADAAAPADTGLAAPTFREGQPDDAGAYRPADLDRLTAISQQLNPDGTLVFVRGLPSESGRS